MIFRYKIFSYDRRKTRIKKTVFSKDKIKVVFFVLYDNMWKCDGLFKFLLADKRFEPYIISCPYPHHPREFSFDNQNRVESYFKNKGFPFIKGFDFSKNTWFNIKTFNPDIVFYQQPYNSGYEGFKIENIWRNCLFGYIPYTYELEENSKMFQHLLTNIAWKVFLPSQIDVDIQKKILINHGKNLVVTGYPLADYIHHNYDLSNGWPWKLNNKSIKRVIWAPHHSILDSDFLNYSNFLDIADDMLKLKEVYTGQVQFAFKPHPVLKRKLYIHPNWGVEKTDKYYASWSNSPNSVLAEGDYIQLFNTSNGIIHDCSTFTAEYLYTNNPAMYLIKKGRRDYFNNFGKKCLQQHYIGHSIEDVKDFIENIIIANNDYKSQNRADFLLNVLLPKQKKSIAENMYNEFVKDLIVT